MKSANVERTRKPVTRKSHINYACDLESSQTELKKCSSDVIKE